MGCDACGKKGSFHMTKADEELCDSCLLACAEDRIRKLEIQNKGLRTKIKNMNKKARTTKMQPPPKERKVVINRCYGGFGLSTEALLYLVKKKSPLIKKMSLYEYCGGGRKYEELHGKNAVKETIENEKKRLVRLNSKYYTDTFGTRLIDNSYNVYLMNSESSRCEDLRDHPDLIDTVETLGEKANGFCAKLEIITIPYGVEFEIEEYDGLEHVAEKHRTW